MFQEVISIINCDIYIFSIIEDEQFNDEKTYLIKQIKELLPTTPAAATATVTSSPTTWCQPKMNSEFIRPMEIQFLLMFL